MICAAHQAVTRTGAFRTGATFAGAGQEGDFASWREIILARAKNTKAAKGGWMSDWCCVPETHPFRSIDNGSTILLSRIVLSWAPYIVRNLIIAGLTALIESRKASEIMLLGSPVKTSGLLMLEMSSSFHLSLKSPKGAIRPLAVEGTRRINGTTKTLNLEKNPIMWRNGLSVRIESAPEFLQKTT